MDKKQQQHDKDQVENTQMLSGQKEELAKQKLELIEGQKRSRTPTSICEIA